MTFYTNLRDANVARQQEWDGNGHANNLDWRLNELGGEVGELCNVLKKLHRERMGVPGSRSTKDDLAEELADVVICVDLAAMTGDVPDTRLAERVAILLTNIDPSTINDMALTQIGCLLLRQMGLIIGGDRPRLDLLSDMLATITRLAERENIDLTSTTSRKFNETSEKVGLKTRFKPELLSRHSDIRA